jgi:RNA polymerase sigma factor (sigma-70 family)
MLYWHIRKLVLVHEDADDVLQNTYIKIYKGIKNFKQKSSIKTWVYRIAYNESIRHLEKAGRKKMEVSDQVADNCTKIRTLLFIIAYLVKA